MDLFPESWEATIHEKGEVLTQEELRGAVDDKDGLLCTLSDRIDRPVKEAARVLKVIDTYSAGFDHAAENLPA